ncbi:hypothetical protein HK102_003009 [Quaeritorhiza haematococci]|nr:hypothetical protein HK102_003009 [Quaeritorhiza haematococci]
MSPGIEPKSPLRSNSSHSSGIKADWKGITPVVVWSTVNLVIFVAFLSLQLLDGIQVAKDSLIIRFGIAPIVSVVIVVVKAILNSEIDLLKTAVFWDRATVAATTTGRPASSVHYLNKLFLGENLLVSPFQAGYTNAAAVVCILVYSFLGIVAQRVIDSQDSFLDVSGSASVARPSLGLIRNRLFIDNGAPGAFQQADISPILAPGPWNNPGLRLSNCTTTAGERGCSYRMSNEVRVAVTCGPVSTSVIPGPQQYNVGSLTKTNTPSMVFPVSVEGSNATCTLNMQIGHIQYKSGEPVLGIPVQSTFRPLDWPDPTINATCGVLSNPDLDRCGPAWHWHWFAYHFHNTFLVAGGPLDKPVRDGSAAPIVLSQLMRLMPDGTFTTNSTTIPKLAQFVQDSVNAAIVSLNTGAIEDPNAAVQTVPAQIQLPAVTLRIRKPELIAVSVLIVLVDLISVVCVFSTVRRLGRWRGRLLSRCMVDQLAHLNHEYRDKLDASDAELAAVDKKTYLCYSNTASSTSTLLEEEHDVLRRGTWRLASSADEPLE